MFNNRIMKLAAVTLMFAGISKGKELDLVYKAPKEAILPPRDNEMQQIYGFQYSEVYEQLVSDKLMDAGIEKVDKETGKAILEINHKMNFAKTLVQAAGSYRGLDLQDRISGIYSGMSDQLKKIDLDGLENTLGSSNLLTDIVRTANQLNDSKNRGSNFMKLVGQYNHDLTAVLSRYNG